MVRGHASIGGADATRAGLSADAAVSSAAREAAGAAATGAPIRTEARHGRPDVSANSWTGRPLPAAGLPGAGQLADAWMDAVLGTSYVAMRRADLRDYLTDLADDLFVAVTEWELDRSIPRGVGAAMVAAHFTDTDLARAQPAGAGPGAGPGGQHAGPGRPGGRRAGRAGRRLRRGAAGHHPGRAGAHRGGRVRRQGQRGARPLDQRGPLPGRLRRCADRHLGDRHGRLHPGGQPGAVRAARLPRRRARPALGVLLRASRRRPRPCGWRSRTCWPARGTARG